MRWRGFIGRLKPTYCIERRGRTYGKKSSRFALA